MREDRLWLGSMTLASHDESALRFSVVLRLAAAALSLALLSPLLAGCAGAPTSGATAGDGGADLRVTEGPLVIRHLLTGELFAGEAVEMIAPNAGIWPIQIRQLVANGSAVDAGDVVVEFDNSSLVGNLDQQRTAAVKAQTQLDTARSRTASEIREAEFEVERLRAELEKKKIEASIPQGIKAERDYQKLQLDRQKAELDLEQARAALATKRTAAETEVEIQVVALDKAVMDVRRVEQALERLSLVAPKAGIVEIGDNPFEDRMIQAGDSIQPGLTVARIPDLTTLKIRAPLFDVDDLKVEPGLEARVTLDAYPELELGATVRSVQGLAQQPTRRSLRRAFEVVLDLDRVDLERMRTGMSAKVTVERIIDRDANGRAPRILPRQALDLTLPAAPKAALASGELREVELGPCNDFHCILEGGLEDGLEPGEPLSIFADLRPKGTEPENREEKGGS